MYVNHAGTDAGAGADAGPISRRLQCHAIAINTVLSMAESAADTTADDADRTIDGGASIFRTRENIVGTATSRSTDATASASAVAADTDQPS